MKPIYTVEKKYRIEGDNNELTIRETRGNAYFVLNVDEANEVIESMREALAQMKQQILDDRMAAPNLVKPDHLEGFVKKSPRIAPAPAPVAEVKQPVWSVADGVEIDLSKAPEWATRVAQVQVSPNLTLRVWVNKYDTQYQYLPNYSGVSPHSKEIEDEFIRWDWGVNVDIIAVLQEG